MRQLINISDMFTNESFEFKTFILGCAQEAYYTDCEDDLIVRLRSDLEAAMARGETYLSVKHLGLIYEGRLWDDPILEISWD